MPIVEYPIIGFQPDLPQDTPGLITSSSGTIPTDRGIGTGMAVTEISTAMATPPYEGAVLTKIDGTVRPFAATTTKIYELQAGATTTDRSGAVYTGVTWTFCQFGDVTLASNINDGLIQLNAGATFATVATAPGALIVIAAGFPNAQFVMQFNYFTASTLTPDGIFWSGLGDYTNWTPGIAAQCGNIRLTDVNGAFTAAIPYRNQVVAFKADAMYIGSYVGGSDMWDWSRISNEIGCIGHNAVCQANNVLYFANKLGLWEFDGSYPQLILSQIHLWWSKNVQGGAIYTRLTWDPANHLLWVRYNAGGVAGTHLAFNPRSKLWTMHGTIGSPTAQFNLNNAYCVTTNNKFASLSVSNQAGGSFTLAATGSPYSKTSLRSVRPEWLSGGTDTDTTWCSATVNHGPSLRNVANANTAAATGAPGRFDVLISDNYVQPVITVAAGTSWELQKVAMDVVEGGKE